MAVSEDCPAFPPENSLIQSRPGPSDFATFQRGFSPMFSSHFYIFNYRLGAPWSLEGIASWPPSCFSSTRLREARYCRHSLHESSCLHRAPSTERLIFLTATHAFGTPPQHRSGSPCGGFPDGCCGGCMLLGTLVPRIRLFGSLFPSSFQF